MDECVVGLPTCIRRVIKACRPLPWAARALLLEVFELDLGPEGCWLSVPELAERLGIGDSSITKYLGRFQELGLVVRVKKKDERTPAWHLAMPRVAIPDTERPKPAEVRRCRDAFERWLKERRVTGTGSGVKPAPLPVSPPLGTGIPSSIRPDSRPVSEGRGEGLGGAPDALKSAISTLPLPSTAPGACADAPDLQRESANGTGRQPGWLSRMAREQEGASRLDFSKEREERHG